MESTDFDDFLKRLQAQNIEIATGSSKKYGISYTDIKGHISSLRADNNRLSLEIANP